MDFSSYSWDLAPADTLRPDYPYTANDHHITQQAYGPYGIDGPSTFALPLQDLDDLFATTQPYTPNPFSPFVALSSLEQRSGDSITNEQSAGAALETPAPSMGPPAQPRKRKAPTLRADAWEPYKSRILELHITQKRPLVEVKEMIKQQYDFDPELRQYRTRISQWKQDKNVKSQEMQAIVRKRQRRKLLEPNKRELVFEVRDNRVQPQKIERWMKRNDVPESFLYSPISAASTPSALGCHTISERGSPAPITMNSPAGSMLISGTFNSMVQSPQMSSPALSVSSLVQPRSNGFTGQSPALAYRSLPTISSNSPFHTPNMFDTQTTVDIRPRYRQDEEQRLREHISVAQASIGTDPLELLDKLDELCGVLIGQGRYKKAEDVARSLLVECRKRQSSNGGEDAYTLDAMNLLGQVLERQGMYIKAERLHRHVLRERENVLGHDHLDTLNSMTNLAVVLDNQGRLEEAETLHRQALQGMEKQVGLRNMSRLRSLGLLGSVLVKQGKHKEAEEKYQQALEGYNKVLGAHKDALGTMNNLAIVWSKEGKHEKAWAILQQVLEGFEKSLGPEHPDTLHTIQNLGKVLEELDRYEEAEIMCQHALEGSNKVLGPEHPDTLDSINNLVLLLEDQSRFAEAETLCRQLLQKQEKVFGPEHPYTLYNRKKLGSLLKKQGKLIEAEEVLRGRRE